MADLFLPNFIKVYIFFPKEEKNTSFPRYDPFLIQVHQLLWSHSLRVTSSVHNFTKYSVKHLLLHLVLIDPIFLCTTISSYEKCNEVFDYTLLLNARTCY